MNIRKTKKEDLEKVLEIYEYARNQMRKNGNPNQWKNTNPSKDIIINDIENENSYLIEYKEEICGIFSFIVGEDPTYKKIEGSWLNNEDYGTIHRVASSGIRKGILKECLNFCEKKQKNIRIDTHEDNKIMQHLLEKNGYINCGIIYVLDGSPRIAYQKIVK